MTDNNNKKNNMRYVIGFFVVIAILVILKIVFGSSADSSTSGNGAAVMDASSAAVNGAAGNGAAGNGAAGNGAAGIGATTPQKECPAGSVLYSNECYRCPENFIFKDGRCVAVVASDSLGKDGIDSWKRIGIYSTVGTTGLNKSCLDGSDMRGGLCYKPPDSSWSYQSPGIYKKACSGRWDGTACWINAVPNYQYLKSVIGTIPNQCPPGRVLKNGLCYPNCPDGYTREDGNLEYCMSNCPTGTTKIGPYSCSKNTVDPVK